MDGDSEGGVQRVSTGGGVRESERLRDTKAGREGGSEGGRLREGGREEGRGARLQTQRANTLTLRVDAVAAQLRAPAVDV